MACVAQALLMTWAGKYTPGAAAGSTVGRASTSPARHLKRKTSPWIWERGGVSSPVPERAGEGG